MKLSSQELRMPGIRKIVHSCSLMIGKARIEEKAKNDHPYFIALPNLSRVAWRGTFAIWVKERQLCPISRHETQY